MSILFYFLGLIESLEVVVLKIAIFIYIIISCISWTDSFCLNLIPLTRWLFFINIFYWLFSDFLVVFNYFMEVVQKVYKYTIYRFSLQ
jgi:hypothetical protein